MKFKEQTEEHITTIMTFSSQLDGNANNPSKWISKAFLCGKVGKGCFIYLFLELFPEMQKHLVPSRTTWD